MLSPSASTPSVLAQNDLTFGFLPPVQKEVEATARAALAAVAERTVASGKARAAALHAHARKRREVDADGPWPLLWTCFGRPYLGAAHGAMGILAMLLHCARPHPPGGGKRR